METLCCVGLVGSGIDVSAKNLAKKIKSRTQIFPKC